MITKETAKSPAQWRAYLLEKYEQAASSASYAHTMADKCRSTAMVKHARTWQDAAQQWAHAARIYRFAYQDDVETYGRELS